MIWFFLVLGTLLAVASIVIINYVIKLRKDKADWEIIKGMEGAEHYPDHAKYLIGDFLRKNERDKLLLHLTMIMTAIAVSNVCLVFITAWRHSLTGRELMIIMTVAATAIIPIYFTVKNIINNKDNKAIVRQAEAHLGIKDGITLKKIIANEFIEDDQMNHPLP